MRVSEEHVTHPDLAFRHLLLELRAFGGARHRHPQVELTWVRRGHGVRFVGDSTEPFADGDLVLLGPQVSHLWSGRARAGEPPFQAQVIQFPPALLDSALWPELRQLLPLLERARRGLRVQGAAHRAVTRAMQAMEGTDPLRRLAMLMEVLRALSLHARSLKPLSTGLPHEGRADAGGRRRVDRVLDWMLAHLGEELYAADAARIAHVSPAAFSRYFRRETGKTWSACLADMRCSEAAVRLRQGARPVAEIAHDCGFHTLSHFNRAFVARFGQTPSSYRRS